MLPSSEGSEMIQVCFIMFASDEGDACGTQPFPFFGRDEAEATERVKKFMLEGHDMEDMFEEDPSCYAAFVAATDYKSIKQWLLNHYAFYDISAHEVI